MNIYINREKKLFEDKLNSVESQESVQIVKILEKEKKCSIIKMCDTAFAPGYMIGEREDFECLLSKIDQYAEFYVVLENGEVLGYSAIYVNDKKTKKAYITLIAIRPEYQNRKIGYRLLKELEKIGKNNSMKIIELEVYLYNKRAIYFYKSNGFIQISESNYGSIFMRKVL